MSRLEQLPADQKAVLSLLLRQGQTYVRVATLLGIDESAVRGRAQRALATLGGSASAGLAEEESELVGDYLLGQLSDGERIETLALLMDSAAARRWARTVADEIGPLATGPLPAVPDPGPEEDDPAEQEPPAPAAAPRRSREPRAPRKPREPAASQEPSTPREPRKPREPSTPREPRKPREPSTPREPRKPRARPDRGAGVLLAAAALLIAAVVVFIVSGGSDTPAAGPIPASAETQTGTATTAQSGTSTTSTGVVAELALKPTAAGGNASGAVEIINTGTALEIAFSAAHLPAAGSDHYVLWLDNSPTKFQVLGEVSSVSATGTVSPVAVALPSDASSYRGVELTLETSSAPTSPGQVILSGTSNSAL